jgi:hypothetical protein
MGKKAHTKEAPLYQGCQIFLDTTYQNDKNDHKICQIAPKFT